MHPFNVLINAVFFFFLLGVTLALATHALDLGTGKGRGGGIPRDLCTLKVM